MRNDDKSSQPASATPETDGIDACWDNGLEADPAESGTAISQRVTVPGHPPELESGLHERQQSDAPPGLVLPEIPQLREPNLAPSGELDDPLIDLDADLDTETPSQEKLPIAERVTPIQEPPAELLELDPVSSRPVRTTQDSVVQDMRERYSVGDFTGALVIAESILEASPADPDAMRYAQSCRDVLMQMYCARLGPLDQVVIVSVPSDQIRWLSLDHRAGFILSLVDGDSSVEEVLDICGMPRLEALRMLFMLLEQRVIALAPRR
jgi:hypothetical protein